MLAYLRFKEVFFPLILFLSGLAVAYIAKRFFVGNIANGITIFGCLTTMSATEMLAKAISDIRMYESEMKNNSKKS